MRLCIPTEDDRGLNAHPARHFGTAPFFTMVDVEARGVNVVPNPSCHQHHGACHHVGILAAHRVDAVVSAGIGRRAHAGLRDAGIDVLATSGATVRDIVEGAREGALRDLPEHRLCAGGHRHHGHGAGGGGHRHRGGRC